MVLEEVGDKEGKQDGGFEVVMQVGDTRTRRALGRHVHPTPKRGGGAGEIMETLAAAKEGLDKHYHCQHWATGNWARGSIGLDLGSLGTLQSPFARVCSRSVGRPV